MREGERKEMTGSKAAVDHLIGGETEGPMTTEYNRTRFLEPLITRDVVRTAKSNGASLAGLEYSVKTASSISDKLERNAKSSVPGSGTKNARDTLLAIKDVVRYTELCSHDAIVPVTRATIDRMQEQGYVLSGVKNYYANPFRATGYMGMHLNFITPHGREIELQVHSPESFDAKQRGHVLYEKIRSVSTTASVKSALREEILKIHRAVPKCRGYRSIEDFSMKTAEKEKLMRERLPRADVRVQTGTADPATGAHSISYEVRLDGVKLMSGFDHVFSDGSAWAYRRDDTAGRSSISYLDRDGTLIREGKAKDLDISLGSVDMLAERQETAHQAWMRENMPDMEPLEPVSAGRNFADIER